MKTQSAQAWGDCIANLSGVRGTFFSICEVSPLPNEILVEAICHGLIDLANSNFQDFNPLLRSFLLTHIQRDQWKLKPLRHGNVR